MDVVAWLPPQSVLFYENSTRTKLPACLRVFQLQSPAPRDGGRMPARDLRQRRSDRALRLAQSVLQPGFAEPFEEAGSNVGVRVHRVVCDVGTGEIRLHGKRTDQRFLGFVDLAEHAKRYGHESPSPGMMRVQRERGAAD